MKKVFSLLFAGLFLALCLVPSVGLLLGHGSGAAANQVLAVLPSPTKKDGSLNADYLPGLGRYVNDRFFLRQEAVTLWASLNAGLLRSSVTKDVLVGKDGWLYFTPTLPDYTRTGQMTARETWCAARRLALLQEYVEARGGRFLFVIAPNKNSLYPARMPELPRADAPTNAEALFEQLKAQQVATVDLFALFRAQKETLYYPRDSHWNARGAALAADALLAALGRESGYFTEDFGEARHRSDLYEMLFPAGQETDPDFVYAPGFSFSASSANADSITLTTQCERGEGALLMYRDSFGRALYPYLAERFGDAVFSRKEDYDPSSLTPGGCLVLEIVERNLPRLAGGAMVLPAPTRDPAPVREAQPVDGAVKITLAKGGPEGYTVLCGDLDGLCPATDSPMYAELGGSLYEALPGPADFRLCLPEEALTGPIRIYVRAESGWLCLEGRIEN